MECDEGVTFDYEFMLVEEGYGCGGVRAGDGGGEVVG